MSERKRINISVDPATYARLQKIQRRHGFANLCELVVAMANILVDRMETVDQRRYDLPDDDGRYVDKMFEDLGHTEPTPDGTVPVRHKINSCINGKG